LLCLITCRISGNNVEKNTAALTTIYTAVATDDNIVAYTLKSGFQKEKFTINAAGKLKYKEKLILIEVTVPMVSTMPLKVVAAISLALILLSSPILAYTLKSGFQKEKFTINAAGKLKYKEKQTQTGDHKVTIIATDSVGNETEQLITVSVKKAL
jgi:hypothetical protein